MADAAAAEHRAPTSAPRKRAGMRPILATSRPDGEFGYGLARPRARAKNHAQGLKVGLTGERRFVVEPTHTIDFAEGGMPAILCTPGWSGSWGMRQDVPGRSDKARTQHGPWWAWQA